MSEHDIVAEWIQVAEELTIYATETRYPIRTEVDEDTAKRILQQVWEIHNFVVELVMPVPEESKPELGEER